MGCKISLQIKSYHTSDAKNKTSKPFVLGESDETLTITDIANMVAKLPHDSRKELADLLRSANSLILDEDMVKKHEFISNISLKELQDYYGLNAYNIDLNLNYPFTLIKCRTFKHNGQTYKGRVIDSKGNEVFIINNKFDAEKLFKHLMVKSKLSEYININDVDEYLSDFKDDLKIIAKHYSQSILDVIEEYLINKHKYKTFTNNGKSINPKRIISKVLEKISGEIYDSDKKSSLQLDLESINKSRDNYRWILPKVDLYNILDQHFENFAKEYSLEKFNQLDKSSLNDLLKKYFANDLKLMKSFVESETQTHIASKTKTLKKRIKSEIILGVYNLLVKPRFNNAPDNYKDAIKYDNIRDSFNNLDFHYGDHKARIVINDKGTILAYYEIEEEINTSTVGSIVLNLNNFATIGEICGYESQNLFEYLEIYKGFYIYKYNKDGDEWYTAGRSMISPRQTMIQERDLNTIKSRIDNNSDSLESCGLWSIKQQSGIPRVSKLEMKNVKEGLIITTLNYPINPQIKYDDFAFDVKNLFSQTLSEFHKLLSIITNIKQLDTPEKASTFIFAVRELMNKEDNFFEFIQNDKNSIAINEIITNINKSEVQHYLVEKKNSYSEGFTIRLLNNNTTNVDLNGKFNDLSVKDTLDLSLTNAIEYFNNTFSLDIKSLTTSELKNFSKEHGLNLENKTDSIKGFVYDGKIYIHSSKANISDLFHEVAHIFLGILKANNIEDYNKIINNYSKNKNYPSKFSDQKSRYQHYAQSDIIEETVVELIADELFKTNQAGLLDFKSQSNDIVKALNNIFKTTMIYCRKNNDNGLGFINKFKLLYSSNLDNIKKNILISDFIQQLILNGNIKEQC